MALSFGNTATTASTPNFNYIRGPFATASVPTPASVMINVGDLLVQNATGVAVPASTVAWDSSLATSQGDAAPAFLGVALENKLASDASTRNILIATQGIFNYACSALGAAHYAGERVSWAADGTHNLRDQLVAIATSNFIGSLAENAASGATNLVVYIQSNLINGAIPAA